MHPIASSVISNEKLIAAVPGTSEDNLRNTVTPDSEQNTTFTSFLDESNIFRFIGDDLEFLFKGIIAGDSISGDIHMGEYRTAKFIATRNATKPARKKVMIPAGPPLAT